jgi:hypothetical protein
MVDPDTVDQRYQINGSELAAESGPKIYKESNIIFAASAHCGSSLPHPLTWTMRLYDSAAS